MADQHRYPPPRGDEADLFRSFNDELMQHLRRTIGESNPHVIEDAAAFSWAQFMAHQPDRDRNWRGWLYRTAQRKAWELEGERRKHVDIGDTASSQDYFFSLRQAVQPDPFEMRDALEEAFELLERLPERLRRVALLRALGMECSDIGELTGDSKVRVDQLLWRADLHIYEALEERHRTERATPSPRADRLAELEANPPGWLVERIGRAPRAVRRNVAQSETRRLWRRAALALNDLREVAGPEFDEPQRVDLDFTKLQARAAAAMDALNASRGRHARRGLDR